MSKKSSSGYAGVSGDGNGRFRARTPHGPHGPHTYLGVRATPWEAAYLVALSALYASEAERNPEMELSLSAILDSLAQSDP